MYSELMSNYQNTYGITQTQTLQPKQLILNDSTVDLFWKPNEGLKGDN